MKEAFEEYGGALIAAIIGAVILGLLVVLLSEGSGENAGGTLRDLLVQFFSSLGGSAR